MSDDNKLPFVVRLAGIFLRSAVLTAAQIFIMSWYVYFALHFYAKVEGHEPFYWVIALLSVFGLWQVLQLLARVTGLADRDSKRDEGAG